MTTREELINQFIEEHGKFIDEECQRQKGNDFFLEQIWSDNMTDEVYELTEDGQHLVLMSEEKAREFKKSLKKEEIRNKISYDKIKHYIQPFQVIQAYFPYTNKTNQYSIRPVLVVPINRNDYKFMMITTGAYTDVIYRRYEVLIHDWKEAGLDHSSYARTNVLVDGSDLFFTSRLKVYGSLSNTDIPKITKTLRLFREEVFTNPIAFMYWLISHKITDAIPIDRGKNNNVNPIQSIYDIEKSGHANCVDLAIVVYKMCNKLKEFRPSTIASVSWVINDHRADGHIFTLFKYKNNTYIFDYDQENCIGRFPNYKSDSFDKAALSFCSSIKAEHPHEEVRRLSLDRQVIYVLDKEDLKSVEDTSKYIDQREWLQDYSVLSKNIYNLDNDIILGMFYRVSYQGQGIYEVLRKKVGWDWKTVKQDPDINWLPQPQVKEYKDTYRSYFTTLGYKVFQAKTMKVIDKYLDSSKIDVEIFDELHGKLMYRDQYQVVIDQGDETMNEIFGIKTMNDLVALNKEFGEYVEDKLLTPPKPDDVVSEEPEYLYPIEEGEEIIVDEDGIAHNAKYLYPINVDMSILENPDEDLLAYRESRRPILKEMQRKFHLSDEEIEEMRVTEEAIHLWARGINEKYKKTKR